MPRLGIVLLLPGTLGVLSLAALATADSPVIPDAYVMESSESGAVCRLVPYPIATARPPVALHRLDDSAPAAVTRSAAGFDIVLRGTDQLEQFQTAKAAFQRAAERWESMIETPITVVVDVDFGPTRFGTPFTNTSTIGGTNPDLRSFPYPAVRTALIASLPPGNLYESLPFGTVTTDLGAVGTVVAPSAAFRALAMLDAIPVSTETAPSIGFNSLFPFDFDPTNGIDEGSTDFDAAAVHEIGHVLGFTSRVGGQVVAPGSPVDISIWDLFRFRPGTTTTTFGSLPRILTPGGEHMFFAGSNLELPLSTAAPDGTGGDSRTASHWKDDVFEGYIGIMDPTLATGQRTAASYFDLFALFWIGHWIGPSDTPAYPTELVPEGALVSAEGLTLSVGGIGMVPGSALLWKGSPRATTYVSPNVVRAQLLPGDLAAPGFASVEVLNPDSIPSWTLYFSVNSPNCLRGNPCDPRGPRRVAPRG